MYGLLRADDGQQRAAIEWVGKDCAVMVRSRAVADKTQVPEILGDAALCE